MYITYVSPCLDASGYAEAARNHIAALDSVGVKVNVVPISFEKYRSDLGRLGAMVQGMIGKNHRGKINIIHATPQNYPKLKDPKMYNIGYCAWETDKLPSTWAQLINLMEEVWVPSSYNRDVFKNSGVDIPVYVMPHPFQIPDSRDIEKENIITNVNEDDFLFYSIFQFHERKSPVDLLIAYLTEFQPHEKVGLVLKTYIINPSNIGEAAKIKEKVREVKANLYLKEYPKILLISSLLSKNQIKTLHRQCDCYVSLHRSEGFGIPIVESMLAKNPVIATGYSGPVDFMDTQMKVDYQLTPVFGMPWNHYTGDMIWAQPNIMDARKKMRWAFNNQKKAKKMGENGYEYVTREFSWEKMGALMKNRLKEIEEKLK